MLICVILCLAMSIAKKFEVITLILIGTTIVFGDIVEDEFLNWQVGTTATIDYNLFQE